MNRLYLSRAGWGCVCTEFGTGRRNSISLHWRREKKQYIIALAQSVCYNTDNIYEAAGRICNICKNNEAAGKISNICKNNMEVFHEERYCYFGDVPVRYDLCGM